MTDEGGAVPPQESVPPVATPAQEPAPEVVVSEVSVPVTAPPAVEVPAPVVSPETAQDISQGITYKARLNLASCENMMHISSNNDMFEIRARC